MKYCRLFPRYSNVQNIIYQTISVWKYTEMLDFLEIIQNFAVFRTRKSVFLILSSIRRWTTPSNAPHIAIPEVIHPTFFVFRGISEKYEFLFGEGRYCARGGNWYDTSISIPSAVMLRKFGIAGCISRRDRKQRVLYFFCQKKKYKTR